MKRKRELSIIIGATLVAMTVFYGGSRRQSEMPSSEMPSLATLRFRRAVQGANEIRLYKQIDETAGPNWGVAEFALQGKQPVFRLRESGLNEFLQSFGVDRWWIERGPQAGAVYAGAYAAEFYNGTKCIAHLRFLPGRARWYAPDGGYKGEGSLTPRFGQQLENRLGH